ncbi:MAG: transposase [Candidatus Latescibacterota bacterium]
MARVVVCDRRGLRRQGSKADQADADRLSEQLRVGDLRPVYHGETHHLHLKELTRAYRNVVEDSVRVMLRLKALFAARGIPTPGQGVYHLQQRAVWLEKLLDPGARFRAQALWTELDTLRLLHPKAKRAMVAQARRDPAWAVLTSIPFLGPVRVALLLATLQTPWRFGTKRNLWAYAGLAVVTRASAQWVMEAGRPVRHRRPPMTRGLNRNHNRVVKEVFKSAASAAIADLLTWVHQSVWHSGASKTSRSVVPG